MMKMPELTLLAILTSTIALAGDRLPATGGMTTLEGSAGGGISTWALITGYDTSDEVSTNAFVTRITTQGFRLSSAGAAVGIHDRIELSVAEQTFNLGNTVPGQQIHVNIENIKYKIAGDAVFDQDSAWPQIAIGMMFKQNLDFDLVPKLIGAKSADGIEPYIACTKVWLDGVAGRSILLDGTVRMSSANQLGILGFGGDLSDRMAPRFEGSAAAFVTDHWIIGEEYRQKNNNLSAFREQGFSDTFVAWVPNRTFSMALAYTQLGNIANKPDQRGPYLNLKLDF